METIQVIIKCPSCQFPISHSYRGDTYNPLFGQCGFCGTLFRWTKEETKEVIPQSSKRYVVNITLGDKI